MNSRAKEFLMKMPFLSWQILSNSLAYFSHFWYQKENDYYEIIAGERRWRAAKLAGLKEVPVLVREYTEQEVVEISLIAKYSERKSESN